MNRALSLLLVFALSACEAEPEPAEPNPTPPGDPKPPGAPVGDPGIPYNPRAGTGEVRGLRLFPRDGTVTIDFLDAPGASSYLACWSRPPRQPWEGTCEDAEAPHTVTDLPTDAPLAFAVVARNSYGYSPAVEVHEARAQAPSRPLAMHVEMSPRDLELLYTRSPQSDVRLPLTLSLGDEHGPTTPIATDEGIRLRGRSTRNWPRKSFSILLADRPELTSHPDFNFRGAGRAASDRVVLNTTWSDASAVRAALAFRMYNDLALPAPRTYPVDLWINGIYEGYYDAVERIDREALRGWGLNRARGAFTLVRDRTQQFRSRPEIDRFSLFAMDPDPLGSNDAERIAYIQGIFDYRGEVEDHDWQAILELARWAHATPPGAAWEEGIEQRFDLEHLLTVLALYEIQGDWDSITDDYWLYKDEAGDNLWRIIPWDKDFTFGSRWYSGQPISSEFVNWDDTITWFRFNPLVARTLSTPSLRARVNARIDELLTEVFTPSWLDAELALLTAQVEASLTQPPTPAFKVHPSQHLSEAGWLRWHIDAVRQVFLTRSAWLRGARTDTTLRIEPLKRGRITLDASGRGVVQGPGGWIFATLQGKPNATHTLSARITFDNSIQGVRARWTLESHDEPFSGTLTLLYPNAPFQNAQRDHHWFGDEPLEVAGRRWALSLVDLSRARPRWLPTYVQPYANRLSAEVTLDGTHRFEARYRDEDPAARASKAP